MASVKITLRKNKLDKAGEAPLYIRVIKDRKTKFISLGLKLAPNEWDEGKQKVKKNHKSSTRLNAFISQKIADAQGEVADLERKSTPTSAKRLKEAIKGKPSINFFEYSYGMCERRKGTVSYSTYNNYKGGIEKFEKFVNKKEIYFEDITVTLLKNFASYCSHTLNNNNTTINYSLNILSIMFKDAQKEDIIPPFMFPFDKVRIKKSKSTKKYLSEAQLKSFVDYKASDTGKAQIIQDMFIFSVYSGGLRFSDVIELQWKHYKQDEERITKVIRKSKRQHSFRIGTVAADILKKYKKDNSQPDDIIFPFADIDELYFKSAEYRDKIIKRATNLSYCHLNNIGKKLKLPFTLSFHVSRHTFATRALNKGMRIEHVSKLMDHSDIGITQVYAKIVSEELDKAVDKYIN